MSNTIDTLKQRRTIYDLGDKLTKSEDELVSLIESAVKESPTAFNGQTVRAVILFGEASDKVWDIVEKRLKSEVPDNEAYKKTQKKIASFRAGAGTVLFYTETETVRYQEKNFTLYADNFQDWSEQAIGGAQQSVWVALAEEGLGASLQHYNPLIDDQVAKAFDIPDSWHLRAEMPFGSINTPAGGKDYLADEDRFKVIK